MLLPLAESVRTYFQAHGFPTIFHRIRLEESLAPPVTHSVNALRHWDGHRSVCRPGGFFARLRARMAAHLLQQRHRYCGDPGDISEFRTHQGNRHPARVGLETVAGAD